MFKSITLALALALAATGAAQAQAQADYPGVNADFVPGERYRALLGNGIPQWKEIATRSQIQVEA